MCVEIQAVIEEIIRTEHVPVRVNGPMGGESILAQGYDHLLMIAGGIAVSTLMTLLCPLLVYITSFLCILVHSCAYIGYRGRYAP